MKLLLPLLLGFIFTFLVVMTVRTSLEQSWLLASPASRAGSRAAILYDADSAWIALFCWRARRAGPVAAKRAWFVLLAASGNIAVALDAQSERFRPKADEDVSGCFRRKAA
jgi:hypothetical protein